MQFKKQILSQRYIGKILQYALSKKVDIFEFILMFLKSDLKLKIEQRLIEDLENYNFENNVELNDMLNKIPVSKNEQYINFIHGELYNFSDSAFSHAIYWVGECLEGWYSELNKDGNTLSSEITLEIFINMIRRYVYLRDEGYIYIYYDVFDLSDEEILEIENRLSL